MTVTFEEATSANAVASVSSSFALTTTLVSTDLVVLLMGKSSGGTNTTTINGSATTAFGNWQNGTGGARLYVSTMTGLTGSHSVSYTTASTSADNRFTAYVIRGLTNRAITNSAISDWSSTSTPSNTDEGPAALAVDVGQAAIYAAIVGTSGTLTFPSNPTPSSGWTTDRADTPATVAMAAARHVVAGAGNVQANVRVTATRALGSVMLVLGDAAAPTPLTSTFVGWGNPIF